MHWKQIGIAAGLYGTTTSIMNQYGALLSLLVGVATDVHKGLYYIVESMVVVVVKNEAATTVF